MTLTPAEEPQGLAQVFLWAAWSRPSAWFGAGTSLEEHRVHSQAPPGIPQPEGGGIQEGADWLWWLAAPQRGIRGHGGVAGAGLGEAPGLPGSGLSLPSACSTAWLLPVPDRSRCLAVPGAWPRPGAPSPALAHGWPREARGRWQHPECVHAGPACGAPWEGRGPVLRCPKVPVAQCKFLLPHWEVFSHLSVCLSVCPPQLAAFLGLHHVSEPLGYLCG